MFHLFHGKVKEYHHVIYLENELFGIQVTYTGEKKKGTFFLFPQLDQTQNTIKYFAFDEAQQKQHFEELTKIQGIGGKSGYHLAMLPFDELRQAVDEMNLQYFQKLPGIGPKTAKRIILELKQSLSKDDLGKLDIDEHLYKDIIAGLKSLGYDSRKVKNLLVDCPIQLEKEKLADIMKWLLDHL